MNMTFQQIKDIVQDAIQELNQNDSFLLKNDISERAISHKLAVYLNDKFNGYSVDCEYNGYANADNNRKYIIELLHNDTDYIHKYASCFTISPTLSCF